MNMVLHENNETGSDSSNELQIHPPGVSTSCENLTNGYEEDDLLSGEIDRPYSGVFEGPEKTLEVFFRPKTLEIEMDTVTLPSVVHEENFFPINDGANTVSNFPTKTGMRQLVRSDLDRICRRARCTILSSVSNQYLDAYVLSESSLFVYSHCVVLKTCGTTTLLRCVATLIELAKRVGLEIDWLGYSRKNFNFPWDQAFPHESFHQELEYLSSHRSLSERLDGNGYTLGPVTGDHWFVFVADHTKRLSNNMDTDRVLNIMMFDIDQDVAQKFYYDKYKARSEGETEDEAVLRISREQSKSARIDTLCPGFSMDARAFEPCGYSMNAILFRSYITMHITPEDGSSYASFETNQKVVTYNAIINNVIRAFRPKRFVMTLMADEDGLKLMKHVPFTAPQADANFTVPKGKGKNSRELLYKRSNVASIAVEDDCICMMGNWTLKEELTCRSEKMRGYSIS